MAAVSLYMADLFFIIISMILDMRTVVFTGVVNEIICTIVILALWRQNRRRFDGMAFWAANFTFQTAGLLLIVMRGSIPDLISIVLANALVIAGAFLGYLGLERFLGRHGPQAHNYVLLTVFPLIHGYYLYAEPNLAARALNFSAALMIICFQCLWLMLHRVEAPVRRVTQWVGAVFGAYCLVCAFRIAWILTKPLAASDYLRSGTVETFIQAIFQVLFILLTYTLALMVNRRLLMEIQTQEEKFSKAFHSSPYAIVLTRLSDGRVFEVNAGFEKISGYSQEEVQGRRTSEMNLWEHIGDSKGVVDTLLQKGRVQGMEVQFRNRSGELVTGLYSAEIIILGNERYVLASINDITERKRAEVERERLISEREKVLLEVKTLSGLLPICASCKKIRDDKGYWNQIESYIQSHTQAEFSHGICPDCMRKLYPEFMDDDTPE